jgi:hypothetical protein
MVAAGVIAAAVSAIVVDLASDWIWRRLSVPWTVAAVLALAAVVVVAGAWPVRQYVKGKRRRVDPLRAAAILTLGKACALGGAVLAGFYCGIALVAASVLHSPLAWLRLWQAAAACLAAVALAVAGRLAEWFCQLPPEDSGAADTTPAQPDTTPA